MLDSIKILLGIDRDDTDRDDLIKLLISTATARLKILLGGIEPPESMDHIVREVAIARFNRIGSEGMTAHSVEGESINFAVDDFAEFADEIQAFLNAQAQSVRGKVRFI